MQFRSGYDSHAYLGPPKAIRAKGGYDYPKTRYKSNLALIYSYSTTGLMLCCSFRPKLLVYGRCVSHHSPTNTRCHVADSICGKIVRFVVKLEVLNNN